jgi:electron transport complex protein RnfG
VKEMLRYGFILAVICIVAGGLLAGVNVLTKTRIVAQAQTEEDSSLKEVFPEAAHFEAVKSGEEIIYYKAHDKDKRLLGAAFRASGKGYSSTIETMVGMLKDGTIKAIKILSQNETPGLGARVAEDSFTSRFSNRGLQNLNEVEAITGATISSRAVIDSVKKKAEEIKAMVDSGK